MILALTSCAFSALAANAASPARDELSAPGTAGAEGRDPSVLSLQSDYDLTTAEAMQQMANQIAAGEAAQALPAHLADVYAGREIKHAEGGRVVVGLTSEEHAGEVLQHFRRRGVVNIEVLPAPRNEQEFVAAADSLRGQLAAARPLSPRRNVIISRRSLDRITVRVADQAGLDADEAAVVTTARSRPGLYVVESVRSIDESLEEACDFTDNIECDAPLRGSIWIAGSAGAVCTAGFNAVSRTDGKPYVLTAGHCDGVPTDRWRTEFADETPHFIGGFHNSRNDAETDVGIIAVDNPVGWRFGNPWITVDPTGGEGAQEQYVVRDVQQPALGDRVCATSGNSARTDCGSVTDTDVEGGGTTGLFQVDDLCTEPGDSGAPYFAFGVAYGVHSSGDGVQGTTGCQFGRAEHALEASGRMNSNILEG